MPQQVVTEADDSDEQLVDVLISTLKGIKPVIVVKFDVSGLGLPSPQDYCFAFYHPDGRRTVSHGNRHCTVT